MKSVTKVSVMLNEAAGAIQTTEKWQQQCGGGCSAAAAFRQQRDLVSARASERPFLFFSFGTHAYMHACVCISPHPQIQTVATINTGRKAYWRRAIV
jgi:hypothetical protein